MYDQSFNLVSISRMLRKSDFLKCRRLRDPGLRAQIIYDAVERSEQGFSNANFLTVAKVKGKYIYRIADFSDELVLRKVNSNIKKSIKIQSANRDSIVANVKCLLAEGVSYRVYRLDVKNFYESFSVSEVVKSIFQNPNLSQLTKSMVSDILHHHKCNGGVGLPRGLALSATLSEVMMLPFDMEIRQLSEVFFYSRYVDDIIIITSGCEVEDRFLDSIERLLPLGLRLNNKKTKIQEASKNVQPFKGGQPLADVLVFEFLGYQFTVCEPPKSDERHPFRIVSLDIASSKVKKIKTRMTRALIGYCIDRDFELLEARFKFLTSNFSVLDADRERRRLAGIFYNYHRVDLYNSKSLAQLDSYLKKIATSGHGKIFDEFFCKTTVAQRRRLLKFSFVRGFREKTFMHFSRKKLDLVQECWVYA
ncbi:antiviral reverse transcriptase Drt3a [Pseudomonas tohonis]|uniref:antiviral reverse transcriptase Drt3a n=1 Tax=Pseudomonas tohonis TaxID=2725477 RepID=UPI00255BD5F0|nr:antiviral reverse transcriptase Drt3a [Pseudomonas tohonis]